MRHERVFNLRVGDALGLSLELAFSAAPAETQTLSPAERDHAATLGRHRAAEWLRGRAALKQVLTRLDRDSDTGAIAFPNPCLSLAHSGGLSVSVGSNSRNIIGLGIDFEQECGPKPEAARFFLSLPEQAWLDTISESELPAQLRRLWTVKEAVFKADPDNSRSFMTDYLLEAPSELAAVAHVVRGNHLREIGYVSFDSLEGTLSIASCKGH